MVKPSTTSTLPRAKTACFLRGGRPLRRLRCSRSNPGGRIVDPVPVEIQSLIARIDRLTEQVGEGSGGGLRQFRDLKGAVGELEERARLYLGLAPDPEGEDPCAFRRVEDGTLVLVWLGEF